MLARATSGRESAMWRELAAWLLEVESDARDAENAAAAAVAHAESGNWPAAIQEAEQACQFEQRYRKASVWKALLEAIVAAGSEIRGRGA